jgi:hypothetical protein
VTHARELRQIRAFTPGANTHKHAAWAACRTAAVGTPPTALRAPDKCAPSRRSARAYMRSPATRSGSRLGRVGSANGVGWTEVEQAKIYARRRKWRGL